MSQSYFDDYVHEQDRSRFIANYPFLVTPVTDRNPYLFQFYDPFRVIKSEKRENASITNIYKPSSVLLPVTLVLALILTLILVVGPLTWAKYRGAADLVPTITRSQVFYFGCIGIGFMAIEVPLTQIMSLYLGHPIYGFSVVLVTLLLATGVGSFLSTKTKVAPARVSAVIAILLILIDFGVYRFVSATIGWPAPARFVAAILGTTLIGVCLGYPLNVGMRCLDSAKAMNVTWAWAVNGSASVIGSCVVMIVMVFSGSNAALMFGAVVYGLAAVAALSMKYPLPRVGA